MSKHTHAKEPYHGRRIFNRSGRFALLTALALGFAGPCAKTAYQSHRAQQQYTENANEKRIVLPDGPIEFRDRMLKELSPDITDLLPNGMKLDDNQIYLDPFYKDPKSGLKPKFMDPAELYAAAQTYGFVIPNDKQGGLNEKQEDVEKWVNPEIEGQKGNRFELKEGPAGKVEDFNRKTSYIVPRGQQRFSKDSKPLEYDAPEIERKKRAVVLVDVSGSMCSEGNNFTDLSIGGRQVTVFKPAVLAMTIAKYYVIERDEEVCAFTFSTDSHATPFTKDLGALSAHYVQLQCGSTYIDYGLLAEKMRDAPTSLDVYVLTDNDILSVPEMKNNLAEMTQAIGRRNEINRVFFIEWRAGNAGYNTGKDQVIKESGIPRVYYGALSGLDDIPALTQTLEEKIGRSK